MARAYDVTLKISLNHRFATLMLAFAMLAGSLYLFFTMPTGFIPSQDSSFLFGMTQAGEDISFESMSAHHMAIVRHPATAAGSEEHRRVRDERQPGVLFSRV